MEIRELKEIMQANPAMTLDQALFWRVPVAGLETMRGCCKSGLVSADGCNCGPAGLDGYGHEPLCGWEPCPNRCWERLHPASAPA